MDSYLIPSLQCKVYVKWALHLFISASFMEKRSLGPNKTLGQLFKIYFPSIIAIIHLLLFPNDILFLYYLSNKSIILIKKVIHLFHKETSQKNS